VILSGGCTIDLGSASKSRFCLTAPDFVDTLLNLESFQWIPDGVVHVLFRDCQ
jgi:hypothetical protein